MRSPSLRILVPLELTQHASGALDHAIAWAVRGGCELHLLHVVSGGRHTSVHDFVELGRLANERLVDLAPDVGTQPNIERHIVEGEVVSAILSAIERLHIDLVIMSNRGRALDALLGSAFHDVVRHARCPVLGIDPARPPLVARRRRVVCAVDFSPSARCATFVAARFAHLLGIPLELIHVCDAVDDVNDAEVQLEAWRRDAELTRGTPTRAHVCGGRPATEIARFVDADDLLVLGALGHTGLLARLMGSVADELVRSAPCPVVTTPPPDEVQPGSGVRFDDRSVLVVASASEIAAADLPAINALVSRAVAQGALVLYAHDLAADEPPAGLRVCGPVLRGERPDALAELLARRGPSRVVVTGPASGGRVQEVARAASARGCRAESVV